MPMPTVTLRPEGDALVEPPWTAQGAVNHWTAQSDDNDGSYSSHPQAHRTRLLLFYSDFSFPANSQIRYITIRVRPSGVVQNIWMVVEPAIVYPDLSYVPGTGFRLFGSITGAVTQSTGSITTDPQGNAWTEATVNYVGVTMYPEITTVGAELRVHESYVDVTYNRAPTVTVTAPAEGASVTSTSKPTLGVSFSDADGDTQERIQWAVATSAQYGVGGFDPWTSTVEWRSDVLYTTSTTTTSTPLPNNTTFRVYARVGDQGSGSRWSSTDYNQFSTSYSTPGTPTISATAEPTGSRVRLVVTSTSGAQTTQSMEVQRSDDSGASWVAVRNASTLPAGANTVYDYEMYRGRTTQYRARALGTISGGGTVISPWSTVVNVTVSIDRWRIKDPLDASANTVVSVLEFEMDDLIPQEMLEPAGRSVALPVSDGFKGSSGSLTLLADGQDAYTRIQTLLRRCRTLLLEDGLGRRWYIFPGDRTSYKLMKVPDRSGAFLHRHIHKVSVPWREVTAP